MLKEPMTTKELFYKIKDILKDKGKLPAILDYGVAAYQPVPVITYEFDIKSDLAYGGSEGIYLELWIEHFAEGGRRADRVGTFKTLDESNGAMHRMAGLLADFIIECHAYVNANSDDFTWRGADVHPLDEKGNRLKCGYSCCSMEAALKKKDKLLKEYSGVVVRDNATREEKVYKGGSNTGVTEVTCSRK